MKKNVKSLMLITTVFVLTLISTVNAQEEFARVCRYYSAKDNKTIYVKWKNDKSNAIVYDNNGKYLSAVNVIRTPDVTFQEGCKNYLIYDKTLNYETYTFAEEKKGNAYVFDGVVANGKDIYYSEAYKENRDIPSNNKYTNKTINCSYSLTNGYKVKVTIDMQGKITSSTTDKNGKNVKMIIDNSSEFLTTINNTNKCPATVCYNKQMARKDVVSFHGDINYDCPSAIGSVTNSDFNRESAGNNSISAYPTKTERIRGEVLKENVSTASNEYVNCLKDIDEGAAGDRKCYEARIIKEKACGSDANSSTCAEKRTQYINCMEQNYTKNLITDVCSSQQDKHNKTQEELYEYAESTGDETAKHFLTINYKSKGASTDYSHDDIDCHALLGDEMLEWLESAYFLIKVLAVVITIITGMLDITKAVASSEEEALKKALKNLKTRLIITAIILILPVIVEFMLSFMDIPGLTNKNPLCK